MKVKNTSEKRKINKEMLQSKSKIHTQHTYMYYYPSPMPLTRKKRKTDDNKFVPGKTIDDPRVNQNY